MTTGGGGFGGGLSADGPSEAGQQVPAPLTSKGVFVSHASEDARLAGAFSDLIHDVSAGMIPTYSSSSRDQGVGIPYGDEWFKWIEERIRESRNVVALVTPSSFSRPWILFEAGYGRAVEGVRVFGLRLGTSGQDAYAGPFAAFQNSGSGRDDLLKLCRQLFDGTSCRPRDEMVLGQIDNFLAVVRSHFEEQKATPVKVNPESEAFFRALEEMKALVQTRSYMLADEMSERRSLEVDFVLRMAFGEKATQTQPEIRVLLLLGIAPEMGFAWIVPLVQYALQNPVNIGTFLQPLIEKSPSKLRRLSRSFIPPEIYLSELVRLTEELQERSIRL